MAAAVSYIVRGLNVILSFSIFCISASVNNKLLLVQHESRDFFRSWMSVFKIFILRSLTFLLTTTLLASAFSSAFSLFMRFKLFCFCFTNSRSRLAALWAAWAASCASLSISALSSDVALRSAFSAACSACLSFSLCSCNSLSAAARAFVACFVLCFFCILSLWSLFLSSNDKEPERPEGEKEYKRGWFLAQLLLRANIVLRDEEFISAFSASRLALLTLSLNDDLFKFCCTRA